VVRGSTTKLQPEQMTEKHYKWYFHFSVQIRSYHLLKLVIIDSKPYNGVKVMIQIIHIMSSEVLGFWTLFIVRYYKN
jgi:hypothetical protein